MTEKPVVQYDPRAYFVILAAYVLAHGITAFVITPIQAIALEDITVFASLVYLPHGVRVLATWMLGWKAVPVLVAGALTSEYLFTPASVQQMLEYAVLESIAVGALSAFVAFEIFRRFGTDLYAGGRRTLNWKWLIAVGALASLLNSAGQTFVYSGLILPDRAIPVFLTYALGDMIGQIAAMIILMMVFRWLRLADSRRKSA